MRPEAVLRLTPEERLVYWVRERDRVRALKELNEPPPWTDDPILQTYRFCNVRRMDDKVSRWLSERWYRPHKDHPNTLAAAALARHFNLPSALGEVTGLVYRKGPPDLDEVAKRIRALKASGRTVFNGAYMVRGIGTADKTEMVVNRVCRPLVDNPPSLDASSMQACVGALLPYWGFSTFMAGQVVADLRWALSGSWKDRNSWAPIGPGSKRGMNRVMGREPNKPLHQEQFLEELLALKGRCSLKIPISITSRMELMDWQNVLCEYDKYTRALLREGKPKQLYKPAGV